MAAAWDFALANVRDTIRDYGERCETRLEVQRLKEIGRAVMRTCSVCQNRPHECAPADGDSSDEITYYPDEEQIEEDEEATQPIPLPDDYVEEEECITPPAKLARSDSVFSAGTNGVKVTLTAAFGKKNAKAFAKEIEQKRQAQKKL